LRAATVREHCGVAAFRVAALGAGAVNVHQPVLADTGRELHPAQCATERDVNGGATLPVGRAVEVRGAGPVEWMFAVGELADLEARVNGWEARVVGDALKFLGVW